MAGAAAARLEHPFRFGPPSRLGFRLFLTFEFALRLVSTTTMASADFCTDRSAQISPAKNRMLTCTSAAFTSTGKPEDFAVLCQLVVSYQLSMRFLFIGLQGYPSVPSPSRSPFPSWLQMVVSSFSCLVFLPGTCTPSTSRPCWAHTRR